jgi:hypothetical protein
VSLARSLHAALAAIALLLSASSIAEAQPEGPATFTEANRDAPSENDIRFTLTAGGTFAYGNARTLGVNLASGFFLRDAAEQLDIEVTYLLGMAEAPLTCADDPMGIGCGGMAGGARTGGFAGTWVENANNLNWRIRYDHYFDADNSIFVAHRGRRDQFAGLDVRLGLQLGYSRVLFREENHRLSLDIGVDGTVDVYTDEVGNANRNSATFVAPPLQGTDARFVPAVRLYLAYTNHINEAITYDTGLEVLWNVVNPGHFRFDWQNHIRSRLTGFLELSLDITLRVDSQPPGQNNPWNENPAIVGTDMRLRPGQVTGMFDFLTTLNIVGTFDIDGTPEAAAEEPACPEPTPCPTCPECPAAGDAAPAEGDTVEPAPEPAPDPAPADAPPT